MGYCMNMSEAKFMIKHENKAEALKSLKKFTKGKTLRWLDTDYIQSCKCLEDVMEELRWEISTDDFLNVNNIEFTGEKLGDEEDLFDIIAPYVEENSYIEMVGEDGDKWRWVFKNKECQWVNPKVSWE
jgi:hypothetical protein